MQRVIARRREHPCLVGGTSYLLPGVLLDFLDESGEVLLPALPPGLLVVLPLEPDEVPPEDADDPLPALPPPS